ncbi:hypothetical protein J6590_084042 [Homalodisca vitripennis]|nr:hypothetical protein J6590_084042 [Homalodisca vitripennis]
MSSQDADARTRKTTSTNEKQKAKRNYKKNEVEETWDDDYLLHIRLHKSAMPLVELKVPKYLFSSKDIPF